MGHFSNLIHVPKHGPFEGVGSTQNKQPWAITAQPVAAPRPLAIACPPSAIASSPIATNQGRGSSGGSACLS